LSDENINVYGLATAVKSLAHKESELSSAARVLRVQGESREAKISIALTLCSFLNPQRRFLRLRCSTSAVAR
jgi:ubiquinone/menaquinone biosynthesis C-methylase UbiE